MIVKNYRAAVKNIAFLTLTGGLQWNLLPSKFIALKRTFSITPSVAVMGRYLSPRYPIGVFYMEQIDFPINTDLCRYNAFMPIQNVYKNFFLSNLKHSRKRIIRTMSTSCVSFIVARRWEPRHHSKKKKRHNAAKIIKKNPIPKEPMAVLIHARQRY